jgi:hypothetical protein
MQLVENFPFENVVPEIKDKLQNNQFFFAPIVHSFPEKDGLFIRRAAKIPVTGELFVSHLQCVRPTFV